MAKEKTNQKRGHVVDAGGYGLDRVSGLTRCGERKNARMERTRRRTLGAENIWGKQLSTVHAKVQNGRATHEVRSCNVKKMGKMVRCF